MSRLEEEDGNLKTNKENKQKQNNNNNNNEKVEISSTDFSLEICFHPKVVGDSLG